MQTTPTTTLSRATLMFPLALVLFEFSVYIGNDLVQPAMLAITQDFGVSSSWAASSMSFYLLGGACVAAILGPLSDRLGRKKSCWVGYCFCGDLPADFIDPEHRKLLLLRFCRALACR